MYKYRNWEDPNHKRILTHNEIFFASSRNFNDPLDTAVPLRFDKGTDQQMKQLIRNYFSDTFQQQLNPSSENILAKLVQGLAQNDSNFIESFEADLQEKKFNQYGIFTMSALSDNILLWSHYADAHKGFCVKFDMNILNSCF